MESLRPVIAEDLFLEAHDCINLHDEWGVGMETLIDQISDRGIMLTREQYELIFTAMESMDLGGTDRIAWLREHNVIDKV